MLYRIAFALLLLVCASGFANQRRTHARATTAAASNAFPRTKSARTVDTPSARHHLDGTASPVIDLNEVDADIEELVDPAWDAVDDRPTHLFSVAQSRVPRSSLRGELQADTSRFATFAVLPRGPPA